MIRDLTIGVTIDGARYAADLDGSTKRVTLVAMPACTCIGRANWIGSQRFELSALYGPLSDDLGSERAWKLVRAVEDHLRASLAAP